MAELGSNSDGLQPNSDGLQLNSVLEIFGVILEGVP